MTSTPSGATAATSREAVVAANVRRLREAAGLSQRELADRTTASSGRRIGEMPIWGLEAGKRRIRIDDLDVLGEALGVPALSLLQPGAQSPELYEVLLDGGLVETIRADDAEWDDVWVRFSLGGLPVFSATVARVVGVRFKRDGGAS
ncbi:helix-turn-helix domain-containing protein [Streptomyces sp. NPDC048200]|uniref:helix-turn-helix domain-containing protein n=1 Tax=Streptomyces sp. NPDC048200 TaxID=3365512 RepID=UPI00371CA5F0